MREQNISSENLKKLLQKFKEHGYRVIAPRREGEQTFFREISSFDEYDISCLKTERSAKEVFLPRTEQMLEYRFEEKGGVELDEAKNDAPKTILFGTRPCDAAGLAIIDRIFQWDYQDSLYLRRRRNTTILSMACERADEFCMCTTLGYSPVAEEGSDALFLKCEDGSYRVRIITEKGEKALSEARELFTDAGSQKTHVFNGPARKADISKVKAWLDAHFEDELWEELGLRCLGCGSCAYVCPTCHCFDIIDEGTLKGGKRFRYWDSCGFGLFTQHASGHNPRPTQDRRFRQRVMHKFKYYIDKFQITLCSGCGRCTRSCPVDIDLAAVLKRIASDAEQKKEQRAVRA